MSNKKHSIRAIILRNRRKNESRIGQARRLGIPETTLRYCENNDCTPNGLTGHGFCAALGIKRLVCKDKS